ncbi:MAG: NAD(+)/NADH kinase [Candidatus Omnitrophica bacterium]|nr:NAD(+)/NADH kinase [Candidatus Omnitrophota bacterium]
MKILLFYKNSTYAGYFLSDRRRLAQLKGMLDDSQIRRFRNTHDNHFWSLSHVEKILKNRKLKFAKACRGTSIDYNRYDLIITLGGDGTFLEAARHLVHQTIWGINSDPAWSVGRFCSGNPKNFESLLDKILRRSADIKKFSRLRLSFNDSTRPINVLNDILICHQNPAAMSRYYLTVGKIKEEQRSSGIWIATAAGSTGGICSAGGKILPQKAQAFQYKPRELYHGRNLSYILNGGVLKPHQTITATSLMREGAVFVDGSHVCLPFSFAAEVQVSRSAHPLNIIY